MVALLDSESSDYLNWVFVMKNFAQDVLELWHELGSGPTLHYLYLECCVAYLAVESRQVVPLGLKNSGC